MLFDDHLYISSFIYGAAHTLKSLEKLNSARAWCQSQPVWSFPLHSYHMGVHSISATRKNGSIDSFILFYVNWKWKGLAASFGHWRGFTAACMGGKLAFPSIPPLWEEENRQLHLYRRSHRRQSCIFQLSSAPRGGKLAVAALPPFLSAVKTIFQFSSSPTGGKLAISALPPLSSAVKSIFQFSSCPRGGKLAISVLPPLSSAVKSIFQFSSALRGGKMEIADMLRVRMAVIFQCDFLSFFPFFCLLVGRGSGLSSTKWRVGMWEQQLGEVISNHCKNTLNRMSLLLAIHFN